MIKLSSFLFAFFLFFLFSSETTQEQSITVSYSAVACSCAQWKIENKEKTEYIYLERANNNILDANHIWDGETLPLKIKVKGYFKKQLGIPKDFIIKGKAEPGKVFVYSKIKVII